MEKVNRILVTIGALLNIVVGAIILTAFPSVIKFLDYIQAQAMIYQNSNVPLIALSLIIIGLLILCSQIIIRKPTLVPIRRLGDDTHAYTNITSIQKEINQILDRDTSVASHQTSIAPQGNGVAITTSIVPSQNNTHTITDQIAIIRRNINQGIERQMGVRISNITITIGERTINQRRFTPIAPQPKNLERNNPSHHTEFSEYKRKVTRKILLLDGVSDVNLEFKTDEQNQIVAVITVIPNTNAIKENRITIPALVTQCQNIASNENTHHIADQIKIEI